MSLLVFCLTNDPGPQVAAIMRQLRPVADEIVIAIDSAATPTPWPIRGGRRPPAALRVRRLLAAGRSLDRGSVLGRLDPRDRRRRGLQPELGRAPAGADRAADVFQYRVPCRWLFPTPPIIWPNHRGTSVAVGWCATIPRRCGTQVCPTPPSTRSFHRLTWTRASTTCRCSSTSSPTAKPRWPTT